MVSDGGDLRFHLATTDFDSIGNGRLGEWAVVPSYTADDVVLTARVKSGDDLAVNSGADICLILGWQDESNYYFAMFNRSATASAIFLVYDGVRTELANVGGNTFTDNSYYDIELRRQGDLLTMVLDGEVIASAVDSSLGAGLVGVGSYNDSVFFDDIRVTRPSDSPPAPPTGLVVH